MRATAKVKELSFNIEMDFHEYQNFLNAVDKLYATTNKRSIGLGDSLEEIESILDLKNAMVIALQR